MANSRYLLDTCAFLWAAMAPEQLSSRARSIIATRSNTLYLSAASGWEILGKSIKGKLQLEPGAPIDALRHHVSMMSGIGVLPIRLEHLYESYALPMIHKDPIDRLLVGQARAERLTLITPDERIREYAVDVVW